MMKDFLANRTQRVYGALPRISSRTVMVLKICQWFTRKSIVKPKDADDKSPFLIVNAVHCSTNELQLRLITQIILKKSYSRAKRRSKTTHYYILIICCWTMVCVKSVRIQIFSGSYFSAFSLNTVSTLNTPCLSVFSPNAGKCGREKLRIRTIFTQCTKTTCITCKINQLVQQKSCVSCKMCYQGRHYVVSTICLQDRILILETWSMIKPVTTGFIAGLKRFNIMQHWLKKVIPRAQQKKKIIRDQVLKSCNK